MEENFLLLFRFDNPLDSSVEFMKVKKGAFINYVTLLGGGLHTFVTICMNNFSLYSKHLCNPLESNVEFMKVKKENS